MSAFIAYAVRGLVDQLREQLKVIRGLQWETTWTNYVYEKFGKAGASHLRQRRLVLDLANVQADKGWVQVGSIPELTPRLALAYAGKTQKTISRDLNELKRMNLILREGRRIKANKALILAFLPARARKEI